MHSKLIYFFENPIVALQLNSFIITLTVLIIRSRLAWLFQHFRLLFLPYCIWTEFVLNVLLISILDSIRLDKTRTLHVKCESLSYQ